MLYISVIRPDLKDLAQEPFLNSRPGDYSMFEFL